MLLFIFFIDISFIFSFAFAYTTAISFLMLSSRLILKNSNNIDNNVDKNNNNNIENNNMPKIHAVFDFDLFTNRIQNENNSKKISAMKSIKMKRKNALYNDLIAARTITTSPTSNTTTAASTPTTSTIPTTIPTIPATTNTIVLPYDVNNDLTIKSYDNTVEMLIRYKRNYGNLLIPQRFVIPEKDDQWPSKFWNFELGMDIYYCVIYIVIYVVYVVGCRYLS